MNCGSKAASHNNPFLQCSMAGRVSTVRMLSFRHLSVFLQGLSASGKMLMSGKNCPQFSSLCSCSCLFSPSFSFIRRLINAVTHWFYWVFFLLLFFKRFFPFLRMLCFFYSLTSAKNCATSAVRDTKADVFLAGIASQLTVIVAYAMNYPQYIRSLKPLMAW